MKYFLKLFLLFFKIENLVITIGKIKKFITVKLLNFFVNRNEPNRTHVLFGSAKEVRKVLELHCTISKYNEILELNAYSEFD